VCVTLIALLFRRLFWPVPAAVKIRGPQCILAGHPAGSLTRRGRLRQL